MKTRSAEPPAARTTGISRLVDPQVHVESFRQARAARAQERAEDYVELIDDLLTDSGEARQVDIAARLGVAQPTVAKALARLADAGYVVRRPYRGVLLTAQGIQLAAKSRERHRMVEQFLQAIGVDADSARRDAEGIEHHVSAATLEAFGRFLAARDGR